MSLAKKVVEGDKRSGQWIVCCGMRRGGSTLQYQLVKALLEASGTGQSVGYFEGAAFLAERQALHSSSGGYAVFKAHRFFPEAVTMECAGELKGFYVYRDIRGAVGSYLIKYSLPWHRPTVTQFVNTVLSEFDSWTALPRVTVMKYEDMTADLPAALRHMAGRLGIELESSTIQKIADKHTREAQRKRIDAFDYEGRGIVQSKNRFDPETLLHDNHISAESELDWRKGFNAFEIAHIELIAAGWLVKQGYLLHSNRIMSLVARTLVVWDHVADRLAVLIGPIWLLRVRSVLRRLFK